jgi:hypothetical protein
MTKNVQNDVVAVWTMKGWQLFNIKTYECSDYFDSREEAKSALKRAVESVSDE